METRLVRLPQTFFVAEGGGAGTPESRIIRASLLQDQGETIRIRDVENQREYEVNREIWETAETEGQYRQRQEFQGDIFRFVAERGFLDDENSDEDYDAAQESDYYNLSMTSKDSRSAVSQSLAWTKDPWYLAKLFASKRLESGDASMIRALVQRFPATGRPDLSYIVRNWVEHLFSDRTPVSWEPAIDRLFYYSDDTILETLSLLLPYLNNKQKSALLYKCLAYSGRLRILRLVLDSMAFIPQEKELSWDFQKLWLTSLLVQPMKGNRSESISEEEIIDIVRLFLSKGYTVNEISRYEIPRLRFLDLTFVRGKGDKYIRLLQYLIRNGMHIDAGDLLECFMFHSGFFIGYPKGLILAPGIFSVLLSCKSINLDDYLSNDMSEVNHLTCMDWLIATIQRYFYSVYPRDKPVVAENFKYMFRLLCLRGSKLKKPARFSYWRNPGLSAAEVERLDLEFEQDRQLIDIYDLVDTELARRAAPGWSQEEDFREFERLTGYRIGQFDPDSGGAGAGGGAGGGGAGSSGGGSSGGGSSGGGKRKREDQ
jgi:uncharacterized membrane protein YgcG